MHRHTHLDLYVYHICLFVMSIFGIQSISFLAFQYKFTTL